MGSPKKANSRIIRYYRLNCLLRIENNMIQDDKTHYILIIRKAFKALCIFSVSIAIAIILFEYDPKPSSLNASKNVKKTSHNALVHTDSSEKKKNKPIPNKLQLNKKKVMGIIQYPKDSSFVLVDRAYVFKEVYLEKETYLAFKKMQEFAKKDGINLMILSGARNFDYQKGIWERKWNNITKRNPIDKAFQILRYSSMPGTSRHHWGTEVDLNHLTNSYFDNGIGKKVYVWLKSNAHKYGFYQVYTNKIYYNRTGYNEERWHWSYLAVANEYLAYYNEHITHEDITGFKGSELAMDVKIISHYVNGVTLEP